MGSLLTEAIVVGISLALVLGIAVRVHPLVDSVDAAIVGFVLGIAIHLGFEFSGANAWYCRHGAACSATI